MAKNEGWIPATPELFEDIRRRAKKRVFKKCQYEKGEIPEWLKEYLEKEEEKNSQK